MQGNHLHNAIYVHKLITNQNDGLVTPSLVYSNRQTREEAKDVE